jgi:hypothetical protein
MNDPSLELSEEHEVHIGNLPRDRTEREMESVMEELCRGFEVIKISPSTCMSGYVTFHFVDINDAKRAVEKWWGAKVFGQPIRVWQNINRGVPEEVEKQKIMRNKATWISEARDGEVQFERRTMRIQTDEEDRVKYHWDREDKESQTEKQSMNACGNVEDLVNVNCGETEGKDLLNHFFISMKSRKSLATGKYCREPFGWKPVVVGAKVPLEGQTTGLEGIGPYGSTYRYDRVLWNGRRWKDSPYKEDKEFTEIVTECINETREVYLRGLQAVLEMPVSDEDKRRYWTKREN